MAAIGYIRVSTDDQLLGPDAQRSAIEAWAAREGVEVAAWFVDHGVSGATPLDRRPGLLDAMGALGRGDVLVAAKRDRLARDVVVAATIERAAERVGAVVATADGVTRDGTPEGALMRTMIDAFAAYERALIASRTRAALAAKRAKGQRTGAIPYGQRVTSDGVHLEHHPQEAEIIGRIVLMSDRGLSHRRIAEQLNADGVPARGKCWHPTTVGRLLRRRATPSL